VDEEAFAEDLASASEAAKAAIEPEIRSLEAEGVVSYKSRPRYRIYRTETRLSSGFRVFGRPQEWRKKALGQALGKVRSK